MTTLHCNRNPYTGARVRLLIDDVPRGPDDGKDEGKVFTVNRVNRETGLLDVEGFDRELGAWRFELADEKTTWTRPDTRDLDPSAAEVERFEKALANETRKAKAAK